MQRERLKKHGGASNRSGPASEILRTSGSANEVSEEAEAEGVVVTVAGVEAEEVEILNDVEILNHLLIGDGSLQVWTGTEPCTVALLHAEKRIPTYLAVGGDMT